MPAPNAQPQSDGPPPWLAYQPSASAQDKPQPPGRPPWLYDGMDAMLYVGHENLAVVGESNYQNPLWAFVRTSGADTNERVRVKHYVILAAEPTNPFDANAVSVWLNGERVGYLGRDDAAAMHPALIRMHEESGPVALNCAVVGGGQRADGLGMLGVFIDYDPADFGLAVNLPQVEAPSLRTGLSHALTTDEADDTYDLSWLTGLSEDRTGRIPQLREVVARETDPVSRHFALSMLEDDLYRIRDLFPGVLEEFDAVCAQHDSEMNHMREVLLAKFGAVPLLDFYRQMAIRQQKAGDFEAALRWTQRGIEVYGDQAGQGEWVEDLQGRAARYYAKMNAAQRKSTTRPEREPVTEQLVCQTCGRVWERQLVRGRKPVECPECRAAS